MPEMDTAHTPHRQGGRDGAGQEEEEEEEFIQNRAGGGGSVCLES